MKLALVTDLHANREAVEAASVKFLERLVQ